MTDADKLAVVKRLSDAIDSILRDFPILAQSEAEAAAQMLAPHVEARMNAILAEARKAGDDAEEAA